MLSTPSLTSDDLTDSLMILGESSWELNLLGVVLIESKIKFAGIPTFVEISKSKPLFFRRYWPIRISESP